MVGQRTLRWAPVVTAELERQNVPLPDQLILQLIHVESRGKAGLVNPKSGASGLMQVMPGTLQDWNQKHGKSYPLSDLRGTSDEQARRQIEVGIGVLSTYWLGAYQYLSKRLDTVPVDELAHIADLFYVAGGGATKKRLNKLDTPTWAAVQERYPNWNALPHPRNVFKTPIESWNVPAIEAWLSGPISSPGPVPTPGTPSPGQPNNPRAGFAIGIIILMAAYWLMMRKK